MVSDEEYERFIQELTEDGCITSSNEEGHSINWELLEVLHPATYEALWAQHCAEVDEAMQQLLDLGLIQSSFRENEDGTLEEVFSLTEAGTAYAESMISRG